MSFKLNVLIIFFKSKRTNFVTVGIFKECLMFIVNVQ